MRGVGSSHGSRRSSALCGPFLARLEANALWAIVQKLSDKVQSIERLLEDMNKMMLAMSQSYYWTPEWQAREERADADAALGRSKQYDCVEEMIADLNK